MKKQINEYKTLVFDCDGVVLNSNKIKTEAFYEVAKVYGHEAAQELVDYHVANGGVSRYAKFEYLLTYILKKKLNDQEFDGLLANFAEEVKKNLMICEVAQGLSELREQTKNSRWLIVSGGDQEELREVFDNRDLARFFDGGIYGSPDTKDSILAREIEQQTLVEPALFLGDSKYDFQAAMNAGLDFVFLTNWTEVEDHSHWLENNNINSYQSLTNLV